MPVISLIIERRWSVSVRAGSLAPRRRRPTDSETRPTRTGRGRRRARTEPPRAERNDAAATEEDWRSLVVPLHMK